MGSIDGMSVLVSAILPIVLPLEIIAQYSRSYISEEYSARCFAPYDLSPVGTFEEGTGRL